MTVFLLSERIAFPPPSLAEKDGLLAVGGDLSQARLLLAYRLGIFPWFSEGDPILWWSPDPRLVLSPKGIKISKSLLKIIRKGFFRVRRGPLGPAGHTDPDGEIGSVVWTFPDDIEKEGMVIEHG